MGNIFIKETKKFYNYISTTHCKDFKDQFFKYKDLHNTIYFFNDKNYNNLKNTYNVLRNEELIKIRNYIFKESNEEDKFNDWILLIKDFADYILKFASPSLLSPLLDDTKELIVIEEDSKTNIKFNFSRFSFFVCFEKTKIKKGNSSLFDTITGLDKDNVFSIIRIEVTNKNTNSSYRYKYMEDSSLINEDNLDDDICDMQLEYIKSILDLFIYDYISEIFDIIVTIELKDHFMLYNNDYTSKKYKEMKEQWLKNSITGTKIIEDK